MPVWSRFEKLLLRDEKNEYLPGALADIAPPSKYGYGFALSLAQLSGWFSRVFLSLISSSSSSVRQSALLRCLEKGAALSLRH